ncbi:MAG: VWA domain-containing protein [Deltaproteobacteria bacterium]|nr:VWA domain-containing protein [Deltaproteobacteria bacterium]
MRHVVMIAAALVLAPRPAEAARLRVALVLDGSQSMRTQDPGYLARVAAKLFVDLAGPDDVIGIYEFGANARSHGSATGAEKERLFSAIDAVSRDEWCTDWAEGLDAALAHFDGPRPQGERRLMLLLTDGLYDPDRSEASYYTSDGGRAAFERATERVRDFAAHPCSQATSALASQVEGAFVGRIRRILAGPARERGVSIYTVGFGTDLGRESEAARRSRELLAEIARSTGGGALVARSGADLPAFFASIFAALVGAPVEPPVRFGDAGAIRIHRGARSVSVVVPTSDRELRLELDGARVTRARDDYHEPAGKPPEGYRFLQVDRPSPGTVTLRRASGDDAPLSAWVIQDLGLRLGLVAPEGVVPEGTAFAPSAGLVSASGETVPLSPEFLRNVTIEVECDGRKEARTLVGAERVSLECGVLAPGVHRIAARARHAAGFLSVDEVARDVEVVRQIAISIGGAPLAFRTKAVPGFHAQTTAAVRSGALPIQQRFRVDWTGISNVADLEVGPSEVALEPTKGSFLLSARLRDHESLRDVSRDYRGQVQITPLEPRLYAGEAAWSVPVEGHLDAWTLWDYWELYRTRILVGLGILLAVLWIVGRLAAAAFGAKHKLYYHRPDETEAAASSVRLARSKSFLPFRSARHPIGGDGKPRSARRHCVLVATRRGFRIVPDESHVVEKLEAGGEEERRQPFDGRLETRYRTGDFVFWVSRE